MRSFNFLPVSRPLYTTFVVNGGKEHKPAQHAMKFLLNVYPSYVDDIDLFLSIEFIVLREMGTAGIKHSPLLILLPLKRFGVPLSLWDDILSPHPLEMLEQLDLQNSSQILNCIYLKLVSSYEAAHELC